MSENPEVRGCVLPLSLHYGVTENTWVRINDDGTATVGMTDIAQNLAGELLHAKPKKVGAVRKKGKPVATVESSKWVGPVKSPISGEVIEINEELAKDATIVNRSPYKKGWIVKMQPSNLDEIELPERVREMTRHPHDKTKRTEQRLEIRGRMVG